MLDYPRISSERHCLCFQGCDVEALYWARTALGLPCRDPLCLCSCGGKFSAPVLRIGSKNTTRKQAVNYSPGNNREAQVQS